MGCSPLISIARIAQGETLLGSDANVIVVFPTITKSRKSIPPGLKSLDVIVGRTLAPMLTTALSPASNMTKLIAIVSTVVSKDMKRSSFNGTESKAAGSSDGEGGLSGWLMPSRSDVALITPMFELAVIATPPTVALPDDSRSPPIPPSVTSKTTDAPTATDDKQTLAVTNNAIKYGFKRSPSDALVRRRSRY